MIIPLKLNKTFLSTSSNDTFSLGVQIAKKYINKKKLVVAFWGDLGAGKTICIKGIISCLQSIEEKSIKSPTFNYLNIYEKEKKPTIYHFDLYRIKKISDFSIMGFEEYLYKDGICLIEWAENIFPLCRKLLNIIYINIQHVDQEEQKEEKRIINIHLGKNYG